MAYVRCSGGGGSTGLDLGKAPDVIYQNANMAYNASTNIAVTQIPSYMIVGITQSSGAANIMVGIYNYDKGTAQRFGYWSNANKNETWTTTASYFTSVTSTNVTFVNYYGAGRVTVAIYY